MRKLAFLLAFCSISFAALSWGSTGHRVTGHVASKYLTGKARKAIQKILGQQSLPMAANWMDEIRSDSVYKYTEDWHWVTIEDNETYEQSRKIRREI